MAERAYITPKVLKWARESARITEEVAAGKVNVGLEKLQAWEQGTEFPTIRQAQKLAKTYKRPFALFFLPEIPKDFHPLQDFRKSDSKPLTTGSIFIIREIQQKQAWISSVNEQNNEPAIPFVGRFSINDNPILVANNILSTLGIDPSNYGAKSPIREWIDKAESNGIFISRTSFIHSRLRLDSEELQGFAIADRHAPFVFINSDDWDAPQLFTLVHELAHIWIAATGISNEIDPNNLQEFNKVHPVERFCNVVAANALIPEEFIRSVDSAVFKKASDVFAVSRKFGVSSFAFLVRAFSLKIISLDRYNSLKREADAEFKLFVQREEERRQKQKEKDKPGGPNYYLLQLNKNSRLFTQTVLDAFRGGIIEPTQASVLLNVQINNFQKLEAQIYR